MYLYKPFHPFRCLLLVLSQAMGSMALSQNQHIRFEHLGTTQGLSQGNVISIFQDSRGFMWFGTKDGLNKYDGYSFTVYKYDAANDNSPSHNTIQAIAEDGDGDLWIATWGGGLDMFDRKKERFAHHKANNKDSFAIGTNYINSLLFGSDGHLWVGTEGKGLQMYDKKSDKFFTFAHAEPDPKSLSDDAVKNIAEDGHHNLWLGTAGGGLNLFDRKLKTFRHFRHDGKNAGSLASDAGQSLYIDRSNRLWVGTLGGGLDLFDREKEEFRHFMHNPADPNSIPSNVIKSLSEDNAGNLWIGTENGGLSTFDIRLGTFNNYLKDEIDNTSLGDNSIYSIYRDRKGDMWVGTSTAGVDFVNEDANNFIYYRHSSYPRSLSNNIVLALFEDREEELWVGTDGGGLNRFDPRTGKFIHYLHDPSGKNSVCANYVLSVCQDREGDIWVGTYGQGLSVFNKKKNSFRHYAYDPSVPDGLCGANIRNIFEDTDGNMWLGTYGGGICEYNRKKDNFTRYSNDPSNPASLGSNYINCFLQDKKGRLWIGTNGHGLDLFNKETKTFTHITKDTAKNSISNDDIYCIKEDRQGDLWIGTNLGLNRMEGKTGHFTPYFMKDGLPSNSIAGLLIDEKGNLWISTYKGLSRFDPAARVFRNFGINESLQGDEFKVNSCYKARSGIMYFGGINGFNAFSPDSIREKVYDPPLVLTSFQISNKQVPISSNDADRSPLKENITDTREISLSYDQTVISFEFATLNYAIQGEKQYSYILEGFDKDWNNVGTRHSATYTNLDPGKYVFKVRSLKNEGEWSSKGVSLSLTINPPLWKTWWFKLLMTILLIAGLIGFYRIRMRKIRRQKEDLERQVEILDKAVAQGKFEIASDVLHDIGNAMVGFGSYLTRIRRLLDQDKPENLEKLAVFFGDRQPAMASAIGEEKAGAVIGMLSGIVQTQKNNQEEIGRSITEQLNIISHIQEILHIQRQYIGGKETQERKPVNLRSIINDSLAMLFSSIDKNGVAISLDIPDEPPLLKGDRTKLMQVVLSVLKNSLEAIDGEMPEKNISIRVVSQEDQVTLEIRDSGNGLDKETALRLFERGFTTKFSGAGLGLYNCREIVDSHEGTISVSSEGPGKGTLVTIKFNFERDH